MYGKDCFLLQRQKRFTFDEQHFFVDLVFYNRLLQAKVKEWIQEFEENEEIKKLEED